MTLLIFLLDDGLIGLHVALIRAAHRVEHVEEWTRASATWEDGLRAVHGA